MLLIADNRKLCFLLQTKMRARERLVFIGILSWMFIVRINKMTATPYVHFSSVSADICIKRGHVCLFVYVLFVFFLLICLAYLFAEYAFVGSGTFVNGIISSTQERPQKYVTCVSYLYIINITIFRENICFKIFFKFLCDVLEWLNV